MTERHRLTREALLRFFAQRQPAVVLLEACGAAHHRDRQLLAMRHEVRLLPPHRSRPYVTGNTTDRSDAKGRLEAGRAFLVVSDEGATVQHPFSACRNEEAGQRSCGEPRLDGVDDFLARREDSQNRLRASVNHDVAVD